MGNLAAAIIDGTGEWSNKAYAHSMENSFCSQLAQSTEIDTHYERGPSGEGYRIRERAVRAVDFLKKQRGKRLLLAGYSRGGSVAVIAAELLKASGTTVDLLLLFDPVARHLSGDSGTIPSNVKEAYVARRKIGAAAMNKYDFALLGDPAGHNPVRNWFGTTATLAEAGVRVNKAEFLGSHGALGGVGWKFVIEDGPCQLQVARFMNGALAKAGLSVELESRGLGAKRPGAGCSR